MLRFIGLKKRPIWNNKVEAHKNQGGGLHAAWAWPRFWSTRKVQLNHQEQIALVQIRLEN